MPTSAFQLSKFQGPKLSVILSIWMSSSSFTSIFLRVLKFIQIKNGGSNFWGVNLFCRTTELFGPYFCILILKVLKTQVLLHSLEFNASVWFRSTFLRGFKFPKIEKGGPNLLGGTNSAERLNYLVPRVCTLILEDLRAQILCHLLGFISFCIIHG